MGGQYRKDLIVSDHYKASAKSAGKWLKLLTGRVDYLDIFKVVMAAVKTRLKNLPKTINGYLTVGPTTDLGRYLQTILQKKRPINIVVATGDPGYHLYVRDGDRYTRNLVRKKKVVFSYIANADHTFTLSKPRNEMFSLVLDRLEHDFS